MYKSVIPRLPLLILLAFFLTAFSFGQNLDEYYPLDQYPGDFPADSDSLSELFSLHAPAINAPIAILFDLDTGTILYSRNSTAGHRPASLTKIMTVYTALELYEEKGINLDDQAKFSSRAWAVNAPPDSSLMFLGPDQRVSYRELILGLLVSSGNDAAMAIAETSTGSMEAFIRRMNENARKMGLDETVFVGPSGYSADNLTSARDLARLTQLYLERWPWVIDTFHSVKKFTYPKEENLLPGSDRRFLGITQTNRNGLLETYPGATGLKTGYIDESGYNIIASAKRDGIYLVAVVLGEQADNSVEGSRLRETDAAALLDFGFENFTLLNVPVPELDVRVKRGLEKEIDVPATSMPLVVLKNEGDVQERHRSADQVLAPVADDQILARHDWSQNGIVLTEYDQRSDTPVSSSRGLRYILDSIALFFQRLFGGGQPVSGDLGAFAPQ